jgi:photosystem II stability/assembly factor-like uncharacterized protein
MKTLALLASLVALLALAPAAMAADNVTVGHSSWFWGNPQPQGNTLNAIDFAGGTGYAAGDFGTLLKTTDNGFTWTGIPTGVTVNLQRVRLLGANTIFIGAGCLLRRSDNGGQTFQRILATSSERSCPDAITSFFFVTPQVGYVLLSDGTVQRTDDGGQSFQQRTAVPGTAATGVSQPVPPSDIWFTGVDTGYAIAGTSIQKTTDGGNSWTPVYNGATKLNSFFFVDATTGYAVGDGKTILKTTDTGSNWAPQTVAADIPAADLTTIRCASATRCLASSRQGDQLLRSDDGGATWTSVKPSTGKILAAAFNGPSAATAVGAAGDTVISANGGANWAPVGSVLTATLTRLRATSSRAVFATGDNGNLARTTNGGQDWSKPNVATSEDITDVTFPSDAVGYAVNSAGELRKTGNSGQTWTPVDTAGAPAPNAIVATSVKTVFLVGPKGLYRTIDGENFNRIATKVVRGASFSDFDRTAGGLLFYGPKALVAANLTGSKFKSIKRPGGRKGPVIQKADFMSSKVGYVLTNDGRIYTTHNGGRRWAELRGTGTNRGYDMAWGDQRNGYLAIGGFGDNHTFGFLLRTSDAGKSWRPQLIAPTAIRRNGLVATAARTAFALADTNQLFYTAAGGDQGTQSIVSLKANTRHIGRSKRGRLVTFTGKIKPAVAGADVYISFRRTGGGGWVTKLPRPTSGSGSFTLQRRIKVPTIVVAQWLGDADHNGDGSSVITLRR